MAKKPKYDAADAPVQDTNQVAQEAEAAAQTEPAAPPIPKKPTYFLQDGEGKQYHFDRRTELPKKAPVYGNVVIDGISVPFQVTSNKGWTVEDKVIEYIWLQLPNEEAPKGFITLDYLQPAQSFVGATISLHEGKANRENPARIPKNEAGETLRKQKAKETLEKKKLEREAAAAGEQPAEQPTA